MKLSNLPAVLIVPLFLVACEKNNKKEYGPSTFTVVEAVTNTPIAGAKVNMYSCGAWGLFGGCDDIYPTRPLTTNREGIADLSGAKDVYDVIVKKEMYWDGYQSFSKNRQPAKETIELYPVATLQIHLIKHNQYPAGAKLTVSSPFDSCFSCPPERIILEQLKDTTIYIRGKGNINNHVLWSVFPGGSDVTAESKSVRVNRFDTAQIEIRY
jgi:hypothetical protein